MKSTKLIELNASIVSGVPELCVVEGFTPTFYYFLKTSGDINKDWRVVIEAPQGLNDRLDVIAVIKITHKNRVKFHKLITLETDINKLIESIRYELPLGSEDLRQVKNCPFCDNPARVRKTNTNQYAVVCSSCGATGPRVTMHQFSHNVFAVQQLAKNKWNKRWL